MCFTWHSEREYKLQQCNVFIRKISKHFGYATGDYNISSSFFLIFHCVDESWPLILMMQ